MSAPAQSTPAVILRTSQVRESDLVVILLTPRKGKLETIARGARKSRKRFPGGLPAGARGEASVAQGRGSLLRLDGFSALADHSGLGRDLDAFAYVSYLCELTDHLVVGQTPDARLFGALCLAIEEAMAGSPTPIVLRRYELALLDCLGLLPTFGHCCVCGDRVDTTGPVAYEAARGGALCERHGSGHRHLDPAVLAACEALVTTAGDPLEGATAAQRKAVRDLALEVVRRHLRRPLKSLEFFAQMPSSSGR